MVNRISIALSLALLLAACGGTGELKTVQQQQAGDYTVTVLSETGKVPNGAGELTLEFRRTSDNQLVDVGTVEVAPIMEMPGMAPMMGTTTVTPGDTPGRYQVSSNLTMAGMWKFDVKFAGQSARISINAE